MNPKYLRSSQKYWGHFCLMKNQGNIRHASWISFLKEQVLKKNLFLVPSSLFSWNLYWAFTFDSWRYVFKIPLLSEVKVIQSCPALCDPVDYTVHGILQARILEWVAFPFAKESSQPRDWTQVSGIAGRFFTSWATRKAQEYWSG